MSQEHKKRVVSALVGLFALLAIYFGLGHNGLILIVVAVSAASYYEFLQFSGSASQGQSLALSLAAAIVLSVWLCLDLPGELLALYLAALAVLLRGLWRVHKLGPDSVLPEVQHSQSRVFGLTYMVVFPSFVTKVHALAHGPELLFFLIGVIWLGDIGAYYGGKSFGRNKLSPHISPGKTREGAIAGLVSCALWASLWCSYELPHIPLWKWALIAVLTSVVAQAGDLLESLFKRAYAVKDSGGLIPGHGGVFDRFDSLILAAPFFYLLLRVLT